MIRAFVICASLALAGCATKPDDTRPRVDIAGPKFAAAQFDCGTRPIPPAPAVAAGKNAASAGAHYENNLDTWGQRCSGKLRSVGDQLREAGQVVDPSSGKGN